MKASRFAVGVGVYWFSDCQRLAVSISGLALLARVGVYRIFAGVSRVVMLSDVCCGAIVASRMCYTFDSGLLHEYMAADRCTIYNSLQK